MKILNNFSYYKSNVNNNTSAHSYPNLRPLNKDTVSFGAMKKSEFKGIDLAVINKYKAPIGKFNSQDDFDNWCQNKIEEITAKKYPARQSEMTAQRNHMLKEWYHYVLEENSAYTPAIRLLILDDITKPLKDNNDSIPPVLNKRVLADTISQIKENSENNKNYQVNFSKFYQIKLNNFYTQDLTEQMPNSDSKGPTGWIIIPSKENDPENFESNVEKLKALSHPNWCTKSYNAEPYLKEGDFHIYMENGKPKLGVRFDHDTIEEIQGELNNTKIPLEYFDIAKSHIKENEYDLSSDAVCEINEAEALKAKVEEMKQDLAAAIESNDIEAIFNYFKMGCTKNADGTYTIEKFCEPIITCYYESDDDTSLMEYSTEKVRFKEFGINENMLLENVREITYFANFEGSTVSNIDNLEYIGTYGIFTNSNVKIPENLKIAGRPWYLSKNSYFTSNMQLEAMARIKKDIESMDKSNAEEIFKYLGYFDSANADGTINLTNYEKPLRMSFEDLGLDEAGLFRSVKEIKGNANFNGSTLTTFENLEKIGGSADFKNSKIKNLNSLTSIGKSAYFRDSTVEDLGSLKSIGEDADFMKLATLKDLGNLETIGRNAFLSNSAIENLGALRYIGGNADFDNTKFESFSNLKSIGGNLTYRRPKLRDLGALETIGGMFICNNREIRELIKDFVEIKNGK